MNVGIIPARMASSRFPGKPLIDILGMTMIEHVWRRSKMCALLDEVYIATCNDEIFNAAVGFGAKAVMTKDTHTMCMDRIVEAATKMNINADIIVTIQGDEPLLRPDMVSKAIKVLDRDANTPAATICQEIKDSSEINNPNRVKMVWNNDNEVLYISREPIPSSKKSKRAFKYYKMVCVYAMRHEFLMRYSTMPMTYLEEIESIDMLRIIENGYRLKVDIVEGDLINVDTPEDHKKVVGIMKNDDIFLSYKTKILGKY